jgi:hypothetical protein
MEERRERAEIGAGWDGRICYLYGMLSWEIILAGCEIDGQACCFRAAEGAPSHDA